MSNAREVRHKYTGVRSFVFEKQPETKDRIDAFSEENYFWAHATLDSRSIWWARERHLVPLLDLINCGEGPPVLAHSPSP